MFDFYCIHRIKDMYIDKTNTKCYLVKKFENKRNKKPILT